MKVALIVLVGLLVAGTVGWFASEQHYQGCVDAAEASHPVSAKVERNRYGGGLLEQADPERDRQVLERRAAVNGCSHLP